MITKDVLYLIQHKKTKTVKIGITSQWHNRSKVLRIGTDTELLKLFQTCDVKETETELHHKFKKYRLPGSEYFAITQRQIQSLIAELNQQSKDVTDLFNLYDLVNKSSRLEVTGAVEWSGDEWFSLNRERWKRSPLNDAEIVLHQNPEKFNLNDLEIFEKQLSAVIAKLKIVSHFGGLGEEQSIAAHYIWDSITSVSLFFIDKRLYGKHYVAEGVRHSLPRSINAEDIESLIPDNIFLRETDLKLQSSTINMVFAIAADCRLKEKLERAMDTSAHIKYFEDYLKNYGPR